MDELEQRMELEQLHIGQRVHGKFPHVGDHGQFGAIMKAHGGKCYVHVDWDARPMHVVMFYAGALDRVPDPFPAAASFQSEPV